MGIKQLDKSLISQTQPEKKSINYHNPKMKLSLATMAAVAVANDKKVPPRHPLNRLNKIRFFFDEFANDVVKTRLGENVAERFATRFGTNMLNNFENAFGRDNCGYYDSDSKHGGPDPMPHVRPNGKPRTRRDDSANEIEVDHPETESWCQEVSVKTNYNPDQFRICCDLQTDGHTAIDFCASPPKGARSASTGGKTAYDRLSNEPSLRWRQITTGARKWVERYISNCGGQRKKNIAVKRIRKVYKVWGSADKLNL